LAGDSPEDLYAQLSIVERNGGKPTPVAKSREAIDTFVWSPNGRYLAYWSSAVRTDILQLFVFDVVTGMLQDTCITYLEDGSFSPAPFWAPDSRQFVIKVPSQPRDAQTPIIGSNLVVDIAESLIVQLDTELEPVGWLTQVP
jgi:hypothetical protein